MVFAEDILMVMGLRAKEVCDKVYPQERPNAVDERLSEFVVVSLPYAFSNKTIGENDDWWLDLTVVFEIFVADEKSAASPKRFNNRRMRELRSDIYGLFPIIDREAGIKIVRPRTVIPASSDGNGYHYTRVQAKLTTLV